MWVNSILDTIGNTPLVKINRLARQIGCTVLAKVEYFNPGGSVKDRIGLAMLQAAEEAGLIEPGGTIIECTSGNTGAGLALAAIEKGYRCIFTTTDKQSPEKINVLRALGAEVIVCPTNVAPDAPDSYYSVAKRLAAETPNSFFPNQYDNPSNAEAHYRTTGPELWQQTEGRITHFFAGAGTGGTISGVARYLKEKNPDVKVIGVDPFGSVYYTYFHTRVFDPSTIHPYATEGVGEDILAGNMDFDLIDDFVRVNDATSLLTARRLSREEGMFVGGSCGLAMAGALQWLETHRTELRQEDVAVVLLPDSGFRYLSKLYDDAWMKDRGFLRPAVPLTANQVLASRTFPHPVIAVSPDDTLAVAIARMTPHSISQVPVLEDNRVVGSLSEARILTLLVESPGASERTVGDVMDRPFPVVSSQACIDDVIERLEQGLDAVLIEGPDPGALEILTKSDLIRALSARGNS